MTKADLIAKLEVKFHRIETPQMAADYGGLKYYLVKVYDLVSDALRDANIAFYVQDEGTPSETAYWSPSEPKPEAISGFQQEVTVYISDKIVAGIIEAAFAEQIDPVNENAIYKVVMPDLTEKRLFVDKDSNGNLRYRPMV